MRARDLAITCTTVTYDTPAAEVVRILARDDSAGLIVVDDAGRPALVLPATQVLRLAVPVYMQDDPVLARVVDEATADVFLGELGGRTVRECLPERAASPPVVEDDATVLEMAALMASSRVPLVAVVDARRVLRGVVTLHLLLDHVLGGDQ